MSRIMMMVLSALFGFAPVCRALPASSGSFRVLYSFQGGTDGAIPDAGLLNVGSTLYGTTIVGGSNNTGAVFSLKLDTGTEKVLYSFGTDGDGVNPNSSLIKYSGKLYGTTEYGGYFSNGTVFSLDPGTGSERILQSFDGNPNTGLTIFHDMIFGGTYAGDGSSNCNPPGCGIIYTLDPATGAEKTVYAFQGLGDGQFPGGTMVRVGGRLVGVTTDGGITGYGTVFSLDLSTGRKKIVYSFRGGNDGSFPETSLIDIDGTVYGTTFGGGTANLGTIFAVTLKTGAEKILHTFQGGRDGAYPRSGLTNIGNKLYGTTPGGGNGKTGCTEGCGTLFQLDLRNGAAKVIYAFQGGGSGDGPAEGVINVGGTLYGTTAGGGSGTGRGYGTVFSFTP